MIENKLKKMAKLEELIDIVNDYNRFYENRDKINIDLTTKDLIMLDDDPFNFTTEGITEALNFVWKIIKNDDEEYKFFTEWLKEEEGW